MEIMEEFSILLENPLKWRMRMLLLPHPRRHWMSSLEYKHRKETLLAELAAEKAAIQEKLKTHNYTLGGWIPKR